ncbi:hypothetical protein TYRP_005729 [Tyrophagus putrescentiae]|nr:hypothetical protein TYRP_005729 [Tyrophagus putrescentiae]
MSSNEVVEEEPSAPEEGEAAPPVTFKKRSRRGNQRSTSAAAATKESASDLENSEAAPEKEPEKKLEQKADNDDDDDDDDSVDWSTLDEFRALKQARRRQAGKGINILELNHLDEASKGAAKKREGGLTDVRSLLASELDLGNTFSLETNRRDEDAELMKYVEEELAKRKQQQQQQQAHPSSDPTNSQTVKPSPHQLSSDELMLAVIPEHLIAVAASSEQAKEKTEEMLSSQMLSGIPEIDLGVEERIRNIEKTDAARTKLLQERLKVLKQQRAAGITGGATSAFNSSSSTDPMASLVPSNLASCFNRHNIAHQAANAVNHRFNLNPNDLPQSAAAIGDTTTGEVLEHFRSNHRKQEYEIEPVVVLGDEPQKIRLPKPMERG